MYLSLQTIWRQIIKLHKTRILLFQSINSNIIPSKPEIIWSHCLIHRRTSGYFALQNCRSATMSPNRRNAFNFFRCHRVCEETKIAPHRHRYLRGLLSREVNLFRSQNRCTSALHHSRNVWRWFTYRDPLCCSNYMAINTSVCTRQASKSK